MSPRTPIALVPAFTVPADVYCLCVSLTSSLFPPRDFQNPGPSWCWAALLALVGEGAGDLTLFPISSERCWARGHRGADPRELTIPTQSPHHLFFNVLLLFLASKLHISWDSLGCSLCSSEDRLGVPAGHRENQALLLPTSPPSCASQHSIFIFLTL